MCRPIVARERTRPLRSVAARGGGGRWLIGDEFRASLSGRRLIAEGVGTSWGSPGQMLDEPVPGEGCSHRERARLLEEVRGPWHDLHS